MHLSYVGQASCVFIILSCSGLPIASGCSLMSADLRDPSPSRVLWRAGIADDCDILVYCYGRKYSMSQLAAGFPPLDGKGPEGERALSFQEGRSPGEDEESNPGDVLDQISVDEGEGSTQNPVVLKGIVQDSGS